MNQEKKKAVVVGGAGFIGSHLADALVLRGYDVHVIDNLFAGKREQVHPDATFHELDIVRLNDISPVIKGAEYVFHLAARPRVQYSINFPIETNEVNVGGTLNVLVAAKEGGVKRVIYSASSSAYGQQEVEALDEDLSARPLSPYGLQKYVGEHYARVFAEVYGLSSVSLRYFSVYGPRMNPDGAYALVIPKFLKQHRDGLPLTVTGDGTQTRDFTHVRDVVRANILAAESPNVGHGEVINIGAGRNTSVNRVAELIGGEIEYVPARLEPHDTLADNTKARELLGWTPEVKVEDGIAELRAEWGLT